MGYRKEAAKGLGEGTIWLIVIGVLGLVVGGVFFTLNVLLAPAKGAGGVVIKNNSAENRIEQQEEFEDLYAKYKTNVGLVEQHKANVAAAPDSVQAKTILEGVKSACKASAEQYNAKSRKVTAMDWKAVDLPETLSDARCQ